MVPLRLRSGRAVVEVPGGTLSIAAAQPVVVALYRTGFPPSTVVRSWPKGIARLKVALTVLAGRVARG